MSVLILTKFSERQDIKIPFGLTIKCFLKKEPGDKVTEEYLGNWYTKIGVLFERDCHVNILKYSSPEDRKLTCFIGDKN